MNTQERLPLWRALSDLFLDCELDEITINYIVRTIVESKLPLPEVEDILWFEVYPVLEGNLRSIVGVWDGWSDEWLLEHIPSAQRPTKVRGKSYIIKEIKSNWQQIENSINTIQ